MTRLHAVALVAALAVHGAVLLFGGLLLPDANTAETTVENVALLEDAADDTRKPDEEKETADLDPAKVEEEAPPEITQAAEPLPEIEPAAGDAGPAAGPALAALSLSDLESALDGGSGGGMAGGGLSLASGGRIGAAGAVAAAAPALEEIIAAADLDERPRAVAQTAPLYPTGLRRRGLQGTVHVVFVVDTDGHVQDPSVERSTDPAFDKPALDAVRRWRFEAGTRNGRKVAFKLRVPITFRAG